MPVDALPLRLNDRVLSWVELAGDDQQCCDVFAELVALRAFPLAQPQQQLGRFAGPAGWDHGQHPCVGEHDVGPDSDVVGLEE